jgi:hypothetical protein
MLLSVSEVFEWLGVDEKGVPYHLHLLQPEWSPDGKGADLIRFRELSIKLKSSPIIVRQLIRDDNWRPTLIGNAVAILLRATEFENDLMWRLSKPTWVAPQVAVGIAMLSNGSIETDLRQLLAIASEESSPKMILSVYCALKFIGSKIANEFEETELFKRLKLKDQDDCIRIAEANWSYWSNVPP